MKVNLIQKTLLATVLFAGVAMISACHTVEGTVQGAGQDVKAAEVAIAPAPEAREVKPAHHHAKKMAKKSKHHAKAKAKAPAADAAAGSSTDTAAQPSTTESGN